MGLSGASHASSNQCADYFQYSRVVHNVFYEGDYSHILDTIETRFAQSSRLIFESEKKAPRSRESGEFYASNEMDWHQAPIDKIVADTVIGFGTNNVWDIAVRKNAKRMIIADWSPRPLLLQEYLLRPLILISKNRFHFFQMIGAFSEVTPQEGQSLMEARRGAAEQVLRTMVLDQRFSAEHVAMVASYFKLKIEGKDLAPSFSSQRSRELIEALEGYYHQRYNPRSLIADGAHSGVINDPFFSSFSSEQSFQILRRIFDGNIYYARTEFDHPGFYGKVRDLFSSNEYALTVTNIIDFAYETYSQPALATFHLRRLVKIVQSNLLSHVDQSVTFFQTRGTAYAHNYQREVFSLHTNPEDIRRIRSPEEDFDPMNARDFDEFVKRFLRSMGR